MIKTPIAIIGAMDEEINLLHKKMSSPQQITIANMDIYSGKLGNSDILLMRCGIGKVNAAIGTTLLIDHFGAKTVINTGVAGGVGEEISIGDIVIASKVSYHDVDISSFGYAKGQMAQMPLYYLSSPKLNKAIKDIANKFADIKTHCGIIASGDQFIADKQLVFNIHKNFPEVMATDMEATAIGQTCYRFDIPFAVIRSISDLADDSASQTFAEFVKVAAKRSAQLVEEMILPIGA